MLIIKKRSLLSFIESYLWLVSCKKTANVGKRQASQLQTRIGYKNIPRPSTDLERWLSSNHSGQTGPTPLYKLANETEVFVTKRDLIVRLPLKACVVSRKVISSRARKHRNIARLQKLERNMYNNRGAGCSRDNYIYFEVEI